MPIYNFRCGACEYEMEELYSFSEVVPDVCPQCKEHAFNKLIGLPSSWHPHPIVFQNSQSRQMAVAKAADLMVKNNDDRK